LERHGDVKLTGLLLPLAACPKARSASIHDRCKARFEGFSFRLRSARATATSS
jgi:hypothetical protein